jgi:hypothetical protein
VGLLGGTTDFIAGGFYAALVAPDGTLSPLSLPSGSGIVNDVAINNNSLGLLGGILQLGAGGAYAAFVTSDGTLLSALSFPVANQWAINSIALNASGKGLIGGQLDFVSGVGAYAAFVTPDRAMPTALSPLPMGNIGIRSVAINRSGAGLVGGGDVSFNGLPYAALVAPDGTVSPLAIVTDTGTGLIFSVDLNDSGMGLIGGDTSFLADAYAAFVAPDGTVKPLSLSLPFGTIRSVAIAPSGAGLIGGLSSIVDGGAYAALVAPNGTVTPLSPLPLFGQTFSVALLDLVPQSIGPYGSTLNSQFALSTAFTQHSMIHHKSIFRASQKVGHLTMAKADSSRLARSSYKETNYLLWVAPFGVMVDQKAKQRIPHLTNEIAGAIAALDYRGIQDTVIGGGIAYVFNYAHYGKSTGHAKVHQELGMLYGSWNRSCFFVNAALWGGLFQLDQERHSILDMTSTASPNGWLLCPHLELSTPFYAKERWLIIDPFVLLDWANVSERGFHEAGRSGFNIVLNNQYSSMLRSEIGVRVHEIFCYGWGRFILEEKASYVNKAPFHTGPGTAAFISSISTFSVETFSDSVQNLGAVQMHGEFIPTNLKCPYGALDYQGEFGSSFQSHTLVLEIGSRF